MRKISDKSNYNNLNPTLYIKSVDGGNIFSVQDGNEKGQSDPHNNLFKSLQPFLILGKVIGLLPFSGVFSGRSSEDLKFRRTSFTSIITHIILLIVIFNCILGVLSSMNTSKRNALEIAESIRATLYFVWGLLIFLTFIFRGNQFLDIFKSWERTETVFSLNDKTLRRDSLVIIGLIFVSAVLENSLLHLEYIKGLDPIIGNKNERKSRKLSSMEVFYSRANPHWARLLNYNWFFTILSFITHKWILYSWNYMDVCIAVLGRAMYFRFKVLYEQAQLKLLTGQQEKGLTIGDKSKGDGINQDQRAWNQIGQDHKQLCYLLEKLEAFLSPLIFASYSVNIFYVCLQLLDGLNSETVRHSMIHSIYAPWSFIHLLMRMFIISICCARINVYAHKIRKVFEECPIELYSQEISRIDKRVTCGPDIGLTGMGCFIVTKPFILSILGVVFTFEIVLLQCVPNLAQNSQHGCNCKY